jgi:hypothetical protein
MLWAVNLQFLHIAVNCCVVDSSDYMLLDYVGLDLWINLRFLLCTKSKSIGGLLERYALCGRGSCISKG